MTLKRILAAFLVPVMMFTTACARQNEVQEPQEGATVVMTSSQEEAPETDAEPVTAEQTDEQTQPQTDEQTEAESTETAEAENTSPTEEEQTTAPQDNIYPPDKQTPIETGSETRPPKPTVGFSLPQFGHYYYDVTSVVLYLELYGELPPNYITKAEAQFLGWRGGSLEPYMHGGAIGGDRYGNFDGKLPRASGRVYTECDIDTILLVNRGSQRLVFSNDGLYFYTSDHYATFSQVFVTDDFEVIW